MEALAHYLHDSIVSPIGAAVARLEQIEDELGDDFPAVAREAITATIDLIRRKYQQVHDELPLLADGLIPLSDSREFTSRWLRRLLKDLRLDVRDGAWNLLDRLSPEQTCQIRPLLSELLCNIVKHARPTTLSISASYRRPTLVLHIRHNGQPPQPTPARTGLGTASIASRLQSLDATMRIWTACRITTTTIAFRPAAPPAPPVRISA